MNIKKDNVIGIVGGMGPEAGLKLFNSILFHTEATKDQDHFSVVLMSFPKHLVDRTAFLEGSVLTNPGYSVANIISKLQSTGAQVIGIACNTCHAPEIFNVILEELNKVKSKVKLLNMPFETCKYIHENHPDIRRVGVMSTNGTYKSNVYSNMLRELGYQVIVPNFKFQNDVVQKMIYDPTFGIKANPSVISDQVKSLADEAIKYFKDHDAEAVILGCSELSLVLSGSGSEKKLFVIDSLEALALALIREASDSGLDNENAQKEAPHLTGIFKEHVAMEK